jgi:putative flippase GtrA
MTKEFMRYVLVGGGAFMVDFMLLATLTELGGMHYLVAASLGFLAGLAFNYFLSISWVFSHRNCQNSLMEFLIFAGVGIVGLALNAYIIWMLTDPMGFHYLASKLCAAAVIFVFNFSVRKALLFRPHHGEQLA